MRKCSALILALCIFFPSISSGAYTTLDHRPSNAEVWFYDLSKDDVSGVNSLLVRIYMRVMSFTREQIQPIHFQIKREEAGKDPIITEAKTFGIVCRRNILPADLESLKDTLREAARSLGVEWFEGAERRGVRLTSFDVQIVEQMEGLEEGQIIFAVLPFKVRFHTSQKSHP